MEEGGGGVCVFVEMEGREGGRTTQLCSHMLGEWIVGHSFLGGDITTESAIPPLTLPPLILSAIKLAC